MLRDVPGNDWKSCVVHDGDRIDEVVVLVIAARVDACREESGSGEQVFLIFARVACQS